MCCSPLTAEPPAAFLLADRPREEAKRALSELRALGVGTIAILTGDAKPAAEAAAAALGIDTVRAGLDARR